MMHTVKYPKHLHNLHNDLSFLSEKKSILCIIRALKQALNHGLTLKKCTE